MAENCEQHEVCVMAARSWRPPSLKRPSPLTKPAKLVCGEPGQLTESHQSRVEQSADTKLRPCWPSPVVPGVPWGVRVPAMARAASSAHTFQW